VITFADHLAYFLDPVALAVACGLQPDPWQSDLLRDAEHDWLVCTSRQSGKSTIASLKALHRALYRPGSLALLVSAGQRQASELAARAVAMYRRLGRPVVAEAENATSLVLENGSRIVSLPNLPQTVRGYSDVDLIVIDEAAQVDDAMLPALLPMLAISRGQLLCLSTPFGRRGFFWELWSSDDHHYRRVRVTADDCPRIRPDFLEDARKKLGEFGFLSEFMCEFVSPQSVVFSPADIEACFGEEVELWTV
jgi:hypothetical protein